MSSEYEPLFADRRAPADDDLTPVRELFEAASGPFLRSPASWLAWAVVLPAAALVTPRIFARFGPSGVLFTWSFAILLGGAIELAGIRRGRGRLGRRDGQGRQDGQGGQQPARSLLAAWALRTQGNLSLVALALSILLVWQDLAWTLPGLWLLLLGHSFYCLGGISFQPLRPYGLIYQLGGVAALWPGGAPLPVFALAAAVGNAWMSYAVWREGADRSGSAERGGRA